jgi:hypothetical protein
MLLPDIFWFVVLVNWKVVMRPRFNQQTSLLDSMRRGREVTFRDAHLGVRHRACAGEDVVDHMFNQTKLFGVVELDVGNGFERAGDSAGRRVHQFFPHVRVLERGRSNTRNCCACLLGSTE